MKMIAILVLFLSLGVNATSFGDDMSVAWYMKLEADAVNKDTGSPVVTVYLSGVLDSFGIANARLCKQKQQQLYCLPNSLALNTTILRQLVNYSLENKRKIVCKEDWEYYSKIMNIAAESLGALQEAFPCK